MRAWSLLLWSTCMLVGAWLIRPLTWRVELIARLASYEVVHIVAHLFLYGTLAFLARRAGLRARYAAGLAMSVGVLQETVQVVQMDRWHGRGELFDLCVDGVAVAAALTLMRAKSPGATDFTPPTSRTDLESRR